ncbi:TIGR03086 family metal-binding protein [Nocardioides humi]|uniref:TIGR03086 family metal-binding protein n=1 Tax=Nocardioides humi TaxID=449461 RepID=A0ABN1ZZ27_9ACTN|nr:TIGR03086 family metal-binding protein [Nocardioides humi]
MAADDAALSALARGLDQLARLLAEIAPDQLDRPTPCEDWTLTDLVDHVVEGPTRAAKMMRGEEVDWSVPAPAAGADPARAFRAGADDLLAAWRDAGEGGSPMSPDWQSAEIAVHTYDLATTIGHPTGDLDAEVAERGLAFMQANLTADNRGGAFLPEQPAPDDADAYQRLAAFAGRTVPSGGGR